MKITIFKNLHKPATGDMPLSKMLESIQNGTFADSINSLREAIAEGNKALGERLKKALVAFTLSATYSGRRIKENMTAYNPVVMLDYDKLDPAAVESMKSGIAKIPHTLFCFVSPSGNGLKVGVRPSVGYEMTAENHAKTFRIAAAYYKEHTGADIDPSGKDVGRLCFVSHDPNIYIAPSWDYSGLPRMDLNDTGLGSGTDMEAEMDTDTESPDASLPLSDRFTYARKCTTRKWGKYAEGNRNKYVFNFALYCKDKNVKPEDTLIYVRKNFADLGAKELENAVKSAYSYTVSEKNAKEKGKGDKETKQSRVIEVEKFLEERFALRYNIATQQTEWKGKHSKKDFHEMDDRSLNSIWRRLCKANIFLPISELHNLLTSDFSEAYDPFLTYFESLPVWDGTTDYIAQLADTVKTTQQDLWITCLRKWMVGMVASSLEEKTINHTMIVLTSLRQGIGKTAWCQRLIPPELQNYYISGIPRLGQRDTMLDISRCILYNIDEFEVFDQKQVNQFKEMTSKPKINERSAYGRYTKKYPRRASFCASSNNPHLMTDITGSRRFLCFETNYIDYTHTVSHAGIYAQAYALYKQGLRFWFDDKEIEEIIKNNEAFRSCSPEEELFHTHFDTATTEHPDAQWLTASQILERLCVKTHLLMNAKGTRLLGLLLSKEGFTTRITRGKKYYMVREKTDEEREKEKSGYIEKKETQSEIPF